MNHKWFSLSIFPSLCFWQLFFPQFFDRLIVYDDKAAQLKNKRKDNLWIPWILALLIILVNLSLIITTIHDSNRHNMFNLVVINNYSMIMMMFTCLEKFLLLYLVLERFKHLNKNIAPNVSWDEERRENTITISDVKIMHSLLYDAHEAFNDIYRNTQLISFSSLMMIILASLNSFRTENAFVMFFLIGPSLIQIIIICVICHHVVEEVRSFLLSIKFALFLKNFSLFINT